MSKQILERFVEKHALDRKDGVSVVTAKDLEELRSAKHTVKELLEIIVSQNRVLLHGSRVDIAEDYLKPNGCVYATDLPTVAMLKAILSNRGLKFPGLVYSWYDEDPFIVKVFGCKQDTIGERGFVYVILNKTGFNAGPSNIHEYISSAPRVQFSVKIEIMREDANLRIIDGIHGTRLC